MKLYQITIPYACFGIEVNEINVCVKAPPIARWMKGKSLKLITQWVERKNGTINIVNV